MDLGSGAGDLGLASGDEEQASLPLPGEDPETGAALLGPLARPALLARLRCPFYGRRLVAGALVLTAVAALATSALKRPGGNAPSAVGSAADVKRVAQLYAKEMRGADAEVYIPTELFNYSAVFPEDHDRPGRLSHNHRTVTMGGFARRELNARYTERFGLDWVVHERETYWTVDLRYFLYWCGGSQQWIIGFTFENIHDGGVCDFTAKGPVGIDILDPLKPRGWSEWRGSSMVDAPRAGVDILATQEWLAGYKGFKGTYDALDMYPQCKRPPYHPIDFKRVYTNQLTQREELTSNTDYDQGTCNNCWAITIAELIARLLCITSDRKFVGPRALISPAYITSCAVPALVTPEDGCNGGGRPLEALWWIAENGIPTGGNTYSDQTCVPFFQVNRTTPTHAASCPTSCTSPNYPRTLQEDLFKPEELKYTYQTTALESALIAMRFGPIAIIIPLYEDFYDYKGGTYTHKTGKRIGNHVMIAHGFKYDYIHGFNSWGVDWGYYGSYRVPLTFPLAFIIPGRIQGSGEGYPYPFPPSVEHLRIDGFQKPALNGNYDLWIHELSEINGHVSFWKGDDIVLYWCSTSLYWAIANVSLLGMTTNQSFSLGWENDIFIRVEKVRAGLAMKCDWMAHGPTLTTYTPVPFMPLPYLTGWYENVGGQPQLKPAAGIVERT